MARFKLAIHLSFKPKIYLYMNNQVQVQNHFRVRLFSNFRDILINEKFITMTVLLNAMVLFCDSFPSLHNSYGVMFNELGWILSALFVLEIACKLSTINPSVYFSSIGNRFDFIVACLITYFLFFSLSSEVTAADIVLLRLIRTVKLIQTLKFVPQQKRIYDGLLRAIKATGAVFLLLFTLLFIYSMIGTFFFADTLPEHFGDPLKSMYSVFSIFMVEGWNAIPDAAVKNGLENASWVRTYFILVLISGGVIGMSLANAIFIDEMVMDNNDELEAKLDKLIKIQEQQAKSFDAVTQELKNIKPQT
jgi:voltage-gated sodium channel